MNKKYFILNFPKHLSTQIKFLPISVFSLLFSIAAVAQDTKEKNAPRKEDKTVPKKSNGDAPQDSAYKNMGVAVTPSHIYYNLKAGESKTYVVKVTNDTPKENKFQMTFKDFGMDNKGKYTFFEPGKGENSLSKWVSASPTFLELKPGQVGKISVTVQVPNNQEADRAAWCVMFINQAVERKTLEKPGNDKTVAFGVIPNFSFGVFLYQNPPNVKINAVAIEHFTYEVEPKTSKQQIHITAKNTGDGIASCTSYIELTNLNTGKQTKLLVKKFVILPKFTREFKYDLPQTLEKGKYTALGVLDYGSKEIIEAAELEFTIN